MRRALNVLMVVVLIHLFQIVEASASLDLKKPLHEDASNLLQRSHENVQLIKGQEEIAQALVKQCIEFVANRLPEFNEDLDFGDMVQAGKLLIRKNDTEPENFSQAFIMDRLWPAILIEALYEKCNGKGYNRLFIACEFSEIPGMILWIEKYLKTESGENELERQIGYETPLIVAARRGSLDLARLLILQGAHVDRCNTLYEETPLLCATAENRLEMMRLFLENHTLVDWRNSEGYTAFHIAVANNFKDGIDLLIKYKASKEICTIVERKTPLSTAISKANSDMVAYLFAQGVSTNGNIDRQAIKSALHELGRLKSLDKKPVAFEAQLAAVVQVLMRDGRDLLSSELKELVGTLNVK